MSRLTPTYTHAALLGLFAATLSACGGGGGDTGVAGSQSVFISPLTTLVQAQIDSTGGSLDITPAALAIATSRCAGVAASLIDVSDARAAAAGNAPSNSRTTVARRCLPVQRSPTGPTT